MASYSITVRRRRRVVGLASQSLLVAVMALAAIILPTSTAFVTITPPRPSTVSRFLHKGVNSRANSKGLPPVVSPQVVFSPRGRTKSSGHVLRRAAAAVHATSHHGLPAMQWLTAMLGAGAAGLGLSVIGGGALAGSLHTVTGPDHLAALLPRCVGRPWYQSMKIGAIWGLGHGLSAVIMGMVGFFLKDRVAHMGGFVSKLSLYTEVLIGLSLIVIGLLGIKEARNFHMEPQSLSAAKTPSKGSSGRAVFFNGFLHGFSWDGTPTLAPALAFTSWRPVMSFLLAYGAGTVASMSMATSLIGESTSRVGQALDKPSIPRNLSMGSSILAIFIGLFWTYKAFF